MKRLINKIIVKINKEKIKNWVNKKFSKKDAEYYICKVCKHLLTESDMNEEDKSICKECSKH